MTTVDLVIDGRRVREITPDLFGPGYHCIRALAEDDSGNVGAAAPTCFYSHETVVHQPSLHVTSYQCRNDPGGGSVLDIDAALVPPGGGEHLAFSPRDIVPTMVEFRFHGDDGRPATERQVLVDGALDETPHVSGARANNCTAFFRATNVPVTFCPTQVEIWGHATHPLRWLMRFAAPRRLDGEQSPPLSDAGCGAPIMLNRLSLAESTVVLQPPNHPQDQAPPSRPPVPASISAPPQVCLCVSVPNASSTNQEIKAPHPGNSCVNILGFEVGQRYVAGTVWSSAAEPAGHGGAVDNCPVLGAAGPLTLIAVSHRLREVSIQCTPKPCPRCCAPRPTIRCSVSGVIPMSVGLEPGGRAVTDARTEIGGCIEASFGDHLERTTEGVTIREPTISESESVNACHAYLFAVNSALLSWFADGGIWDDANADAQFAWASVPMSRLELQLETECSQKDP